MRYKCNCKIRSDLLTTVAKIQNHNYIALFIVENLIKVHVYTVLKYTVAS